jgi:hypothetical protein
LSAQYLGGEAFGTKFEHRLDFWTSYQFACQKAMGHHLIEAQPA